MLLRTKLHDALKGCAQLCSSGLGKMSDHLSIVPVPFVYRGRPLGIPPKVEATALAFQCGKHLDGNSVQQVPDLAEKFEG